MTMTRLRWRRGQPWVRIDRPLPVSLILGFLAALRGASMFVMPTYSASLTVAEQLAALRVWGGTFTVLGVVLAIAVATRWRAVLRVSHALAMGIYGMFLFALLWSAAWYGVGFSSAGGLALTLLAHMIVIRAYAPPPKQTPEREEQPPPAPIEGA